MLKFCMHSESKDRTNTMHVETFENPCSVPFFPKHCDQIFPGKNQQTFPLVAMTQHNTACLWILYLVIYTKNSRGEQQKEEFHFPRLYFRVQSDLLLIGKIPGKMLALKETLSILASTIETIRTVN